MFVFGYGSLSPNTRQAPHVQVATIAGHVRTWDVAMDNIVDIPGYKYYVDPATGERPAVRVTFLDLSPATDRSCVGFLLPADPTILARLDRRERNYDRVEVTEQIRAEHPIKTRVYTYLGTPEARERYADAAATDTAVIARAYADGVLQAYRDAGLWEQYTASTRPPECPVRELTRVNLPEAPAAHVRA